MGYDLFRALSGDRAFLSPSLAKRRPQTSRQRRGAKTTRLRRPRHAHPSNALPRPSHPAPNVRDDWPNALLWGRGTARRSASDLPDGL